MMKCVCRNCDKPRLIEALKTKRIRDIACGSSHSAAITSSGELYSWGLGEYGRLGHGDNTTQLRPKLVRVYLHHQLGSLVLLDWHWRLLPYKLKTPLLIEISTV